MGSSVHPLISKTHSLKCNRIWRHSFVSVPGNIKGELPKVCAHVLHKVLDPKVFPPPPSAPQMWAAFQWSRPGGNLRVTVCDDAPKYLKSLNGTLQTVTLATMAFSFLILCRAIQRSLWEAA